MFVEGNVSSSEIWFHYIFFLIHVAATVDFLVSRIGQSIAFHRKINVTQKICLSFFFFLFCQFSVCISVCKLCKFLSLFFVCSSLSLLVKSFGPMDSLSFFNLSRRKICKIFTPIFRKIAFGLISF